MVEMKRLVDKTDKNNNSVIFIFFTSFIRIRGVVNWSAISFFGFLLGTTSLNIISYMIPLFVFIVSTFFILAFTFAINNYYDIDSDKKNPRRAHLNAMASGTILKRTGMSLNIVFIIIPLVLSILYKFEVFIFCALLIFWMWAYSAPPLRLKGRPGVDILWHYIAFAALVLWGSYLAGSVTVINELVALAFGIYGCIAQIDNHIRDYPFDKASGSKTFAVWVGTRKANTTLELFLIIYMISLIPLIVLYSFYSLFTILILCGGIIIGLFIVKRKKGPLTSSLYRFIIVFGESVFLSCLLYHIYSIL
jgi:4-hydroxybenzoate polyprenyltransferase